MLIEIPLKSMLILSRIIRNGVVVPIRLQRSLYSVAQRSFSKTSKIFSNDLTKLFDDQRYFNRFNEENNDSMFFAGRRTGLFMNEALTTPRGLVDFSKESLTKAKELVNTMLEDVRKSEEGKVNYVRKLDQLSDILCRVIDVAEFIRVAHPSKKWVKAAQQTHEIMFEYMNQLNTNVDLYVELKKVLEDPDIVRHLSSEEIQVGEYLKEDFERSGIHMDPETRNNFVSITQEISLLGSKFSNDLHALESYWCEVTKEEFEEMNDTLLKNEILSYQSKFSNFGNNLYIPLTGSIPFTILSHCSSDSIRKKVWIALHNSTKEQVETLDAFLKYRAFLSKMLGYKSFAEYQLEHKMAKNPDNVVAFLQNLQKSLVKGGVSRELKQLYQFKENKIPNASDEEIIDDLKPWDRDYLLNKLRQSKKDHSSISNIQEYFSVGTVMAGLSKLFTRLYNVELIPEQTQTGETWDRSQVRKIKVFDRSKNEKLGYLYLDFWSPKVLPSHFTIVCLRKLNDSIETESKEEMGKLVHLDDSGEYQLPVISLICNFARSSGSSIGKFAGVDYEKPTLLTLDQVDTIFHEMGHAMHSMIGKTELHNLSGTRCLTDFVELPSVLMEYFSRDPRVLSEIGKHYETKEQLSIQQIEKYKEDRVNVDECESFMQSKMAMMDQVLHSEDVVKMLEHDFDSFNSTEIYHQLEANLRVFADKWSTWHGKFPHLFSYGAVYYSYLLDRAIAEKIWKGLFIEDPWNRNAGETYKNSILKWGGTRDPWVCLADALGNEQLRLGDHKAMEIIGQK